MKSLKRFNNLKANSILESIIAIAIISSSILVCFVIFTNVAKQSNSIKYYIAKQKTEELSEQTINTKNYKNDLFEYDGYSIDKQIEIKKEINMVLVTWTIKTGGKTHISHQLIPYDEN